MSASARLHVNFRSGTTLHKRCTLNIIERSLRVLFAAYTIRGRKWELGANGRAWNAHSLADGRWTRGKSVYRVRILGLWSEDLWILVSGMNGIRLCRLRPCKQTRLVPYPIPKGGFYLVQRPRWRVSCTWMGMTHFTSNGFLICGSASIN